MSSITELILYNTLYPFSEQESCFTLILPHSAT